MPRALRPLLGLVLLASLVTPARAGSEPWSVAFERGLADMLAGRYDTGCPSLAESYRLAPKPGTLFTLAECEAKWGKSATALGHYDEYLKTFAGMTAEQKSQQRGRDKVAMDARAKLDAQAPRLTLALPAGAPAGTVVRRNGEMLGADAVAAEAILDPGEHVISTEAPGTPPREQRVVLAAGDRKRIELEIAETPAPAAPPPDAPGSAPIPRRTLVFVAAGVGAAGLVVGGVTGALALGKKGTVGDHCDVDAHRCDREGKEAVDAGQTLGTISTVGFVVGVAGAAAAVVLFLTEPKASAETGRRRISPFVATGPRAGALGLEGSW